LQEEVKAAYEAYQFQHIFQKVHHFCVIDLGGFYLDIIKDRQYTAKTDGLARRSAQTAMFHVLEALTRWLAPIISYTADEIWQYLPGERSESVFLETWYEGLCLLPDNAVLNREFWQTVMAVRTAVSKELEKSRAKGDIGSSLNAEVELYCNPEVLTALNQIASELHFVLITSKATLLAESACPADAMVTEIDGIKLKVIVSAQTKCVRCWHQRDDIGSHPEHPELCGRCAENVAGAGESRQFA
jgi:isoleucyl-tRNA synthetase